MNETSYCPEQSAQSHTPFHSANDGHEIQQRDIVSSRRNGQAAVDLSGTATEEPLAAQERPERQQPPQRQREQQAEQPLRNDSSSSGNPKIKFSEDYWKLAILSYPKTAVLTQVKEVNLEDLPEEFKEMDTRYYPSTLNDKMAASIGDLLSDGKRGLFMHYPLPKKGKYLALGFGDGDILWQTKDWDKSEASKWFGLIAEVFGNPKDFCTLRSRYGKHGDKLSYYRSMIGKEFEVVLP